MFKVDDRKKSEKTAAECAPEYNTLLNLFANYIVATCDEVEKKEALEAAFHATNAVLTAFYAKEQIPEPYRAWEHPRRKSA